MMKKVAVLMILVLLVAAIPGGSVAAKSYIEVVTIVGPDWFGEIELTESEIPESLVLGGFFNPQQPVSPPADLGRGYLITRGYDDDGERRMFDRMMFFPGEPGYVYYLEIINGSGPYDGYWFTVAEGEGEALLSALSAEGIRLPADTVEINSTAPEPAPEPLDLMPALGIGLTALIGVAAGWILRAARDRTKLANMA
jgi:hypothetical protein